MISHKWKAYKTKWERILKLRKRKHLRKDVQATKDEEYNRSTLSRAEDPILPDDPIEDLSKILLKTGIVISHH